MSDAVMHSPSNGRRSGELFGHPTCLFTLFFAEMWERFSFYGMKALLILYMVNYLFWRQDEASHLMAWYAGLVYATPILGGIIADKWIGARWSVVVGGVLIAIGHFCLAFEPLPFFYAGLGFLIAGVGFLKPNISTQVGALYRSKDERRDSAFTIFYMGINLGAFLGPLVCDWLRLNYGWHYGFGAAGVGMVLGLIVYIAGMQSVVRRAKLIATEEEGAGGEEASEAPVATGGQKSRETQPSTGMPRADVPLSKVYLDRSIVLVVICIFAILFWVGFEQAANVMNLWADKHTNLYVFRATAPMVEVAGAQPVSAPAADTAGGGLSNWAMGAAMTQSINPFFIIALAAVFAWLWQYLDRRGRQPSTPVKMMMGVFFLSCAYGIMLMAAQAENRQTSAPLANLPSGLQSDAEQRVIRVIDEDGAQETVYYGATRLTWSNGTLRMRGVLTDLDWMRALGATSSEAFQTVVADLATRAENRAEEARQSKKAGTMAKDAGWEVTVSVPAEIGELVAVADWPTKTVDDQPVPKVSWDPGERRLTANDTLTEKDKAQVLAAGADGEFRRALTDLYQASSVAKISILWLLAFYCVLTIGELCISPVGLSLVTKAAPPAYVGLFMGFWFFTTGAVSNYVAHFVGGYWGTMTPAEYFMIFGVLGVIATVIMLLLLRVLRPMLHGIH